MKKKAEQTQTAPIQLRVDVAGVIREEGGGRNVVLISDGKATDDVLRRIVASTNALAGYSIEDIESRKFEQMDNNTMNNSRGVLNSGSKNRITVKT